MRAHTEELHKSRKNGRSLYIETYLDEQGVICSQNIGVYNSHGLYSAIFDDHPLTPEFLRKVATDIEKAGYKK